MVKPQFEVDKEGLGKGGVVRDSSHRAAAVAGIAAAAAERGWGAVAVATSPLPGPAGNIEYFLWLRQGAAAVTEPEIDAEVSRSGTVGVADERL
jgi:23S rRNA (cytidine1920-2'-O)/16S rRNA (cytidine1409-2'-O)-methyltransferase